ncbi:MAG: UDP-N-acetylmuramate dehydrogenase [Brumimicrobium sp.]
MLQKNVDITHLTTFGVPVKAKYFATFSTIDELQKLLKEATDKELLILGGGSNVLFTKDFNGIVLQNKIQGIEVVEENKDEIILKVGAGENWHQFVQYTMQNNWGGIENLSLIPGSVGASPMQNIGAYGVEIKDVFVSLEALEIATGKLRVFQHEECEFGYRESIFKRTLKRKYIITSVNYRLTKTHKVNTSYGAIEKELERRNITNPTIQDVGEAVIAIRQEKLPDPKEVGSGGSFFKNPIIPISLFKEIKQNFGNIPFYPIDDKVVKVPAGWLIDNAGWKGKRFGNYGVYDKQALVLVNYDNASGEDIYKLSQKIINDIKNKYNITLEREVNIIS